MPNLNPCKNCKHWQPLPEDPIIGHCRKYQESRFQLETCQQWEFGKQRPTKRYCMHETAKYETALSKADADCYDDDD